MAKQCESLVLLMPGKQVSIVFSFLISGLLFLNPLPEIKSSLLFDSLIF